MCAKAPHYWVVVNSSSATTHLMDIIYISPTFAAFWSGYWARGIGYIILYSFLPFPIYSTLSDFRVDWNLYWVTMAISGFKRPKKPTGMQRVNTIAVAYLRSWSRLEKHMDARLSLPLATKLLLRCTVLIWCFVLTSVRLGDISWNQRKH